MADVEVIAPYGDLLHATDRYGLRLIVSARATPWLTGLGSQEVGYFAILAA